ncbi:MAG TPA: CbiX/SirB N-terminal domain-containing protein [Candidatus Competibacteraceae bacterium]|nr:CbiX/SirB N-terminal domain-containing protein [Candidatus Competibacteraceae bacterium]
MTPLPKAATLGISAKLLRAARDRIETSELEFGQGYERRQSLLIVVGEGSAEPEINALTAKFTRMLWEGMGFGWAETCYGEVAQPSLGECLKQVPVLGLQWVIVFPWVLLDPTLIEKIQDTVATYRQAHGENEIVVASPLDNHPLLLESLLERLYQAEHGSEAMNCQFCRYREASEAKGWGKS